MVRASWLCSQDALTADLAWVPQLPPSTLAPPRFLLISLNLPCFEYALLSFLMFNYSELKLLESEAAYYRGG